MPLVLDVVTQSLSPRREHIFSDYDEDPRFNFNWWHSGSAKSPVSFCRFLDGEEEVGRAKVLPGAGTYSGYTTWSCPPGGVTEIDLIEIRPDLRGHGLGGRAVHEIGLHYGEPIVAMSLDHTSDPFWRSLGWTGHSHPDGDRYATLFTSMCE
jgi:hypothetical protein